jgi:thiol-disulfide isomerase/thioredoxin
MKVMSTMLRLSATVLTSIILSGLLVAGDHGRVDWFEGTFDQALAEAARSKRIVLVEFWAKTCPYCLQLDRQTLNDNTVVEEARGFVCLPVDAESADGRPIAERYGITGWPTLVFLEPDGTLRDRLAGFRGPQQLVGEFHRVHAGLGTLGEIERRVAANPKDAVARLDLVERLRELHDERWSREMTAAREAIERGEGFDAKSPDDLDAVARRLRRCGDAQGYEQKMAAIRALDPEGRSAPLRRLALEQRLQGLNARLKKDGVFDSAPVRAFLAEEQHTSVLFEGWSALYATAARRAKNGSDPAAADVCKQARECAREAWKRCPPDRTADFGRQIAESFRAFESQLGEDERAFALEVAAKASEAAPRSVDHLETLAAWLELAGRKQDAIAALERAQSIEPYRASVRLKLEALRR